MAYKPQSLLGMTLDPTNPINRGLVGWWPLNEGGGARANDISGKGNIGSLSGSAKWAGGMNSNGVYFDAVSSEITTTTNYGTCASLVTMTLSAWINTSDIVTGGKKIVGIESTQTGTGSTGYDRTLNFGQDGYLHGRIYDGASKQVTSLRTINDSKWHHAVLTVTNNVSIRLYLDGQFQGSTGIGATYTGYTNSWLRIGGYKNLLGAPYYGIDGYFLGFINNVRMWNRALSATEINQLYTQPSVGLYTPNTAKYFVSAGGTTYTLSCSAGSFALTGNSTGLIASRKLSASAGTYTLSGQTVAFKASRKLTAETGAYTLTGNNANLVYTPASGATYTLSASKGTFTLTGNSANLKVSRKLTAGIGAYTLTGNSTGLSYGRRMTASVGTFTLTGVSANLNVSRKVACDTGAYVLTGQNVRLLYTPVGGFSGPESPPIFITRKVYMDLNR